MTETERMTIELACDKLCRQMANLSDSNQFEALCDLFTADGIYTRPSLPREEIVGRPAILAAYRKRPPLTLRHLVTNCVIEVLSPEEATGLSYITFLAAPQTDTPLPHEAGPMQFGEFRDRFVLTQQGWRIAERRGRLVLKTV